MGLTWAQVGLSVHVGRRLAQVPPSLVHDAHTVAVCRGTNWLPEESEGFLLLQPWAAEVIQCSLDVLQQVTPGHQLQHEPAALIGLIQLHLQPTHLPSPRGRAKGMLELSRVPDPGSRMGLGSSPGVKGRSKVGGGDSRPGASSWLGRATLGEAEGGDRLCPGFCPHVQVLVGSVE